MPEAVITYTTSRRSPKDAATIAILLLKAGLGIDLDPAPVSAPKRPVLTGGAMAEVG
ncbi:hypothetical protein ABLE91_05735 [Aquabacter sp. CN5-332]|uniref:hypothetical protein n=1 Tax=Aquabacter sp. CN5-332 TaxID=3156608 RepID=UPI0032B5F0CA